MGDNFFSNKDEVTDAYLRIRNNDNQDMWLLLKYDGNNVVLSGTGSLYEQFLVKLGDDERAYGYLRVETGDEMSKRAKFVFITWIGKEVSPLKKARVSTDKATVKAVLCDFAVEKFTDDKEDLKLDTIKDEVKKAGGANYGTGKRD